MQDFGIRNFHRVTRWTFNKVTFCQLWMINIHLSKDAFQVDDITFVGTFEYDHFVRCVQQHAIDIMGLPGCEVRFYSESCQNN